MLDKVAPYYKAATGLLVPFLGSIAFALTDASEANSVITTGEWVQAVVLGLVGGGAVFSIPNKDPRAQHQAESVQPPDGTRRHEVGAVDSGLIVTIAAVVVIVCGIIFIAQAL